MNARLTLSIASIFLLTLASGCFEDPLMPMASDDAESNDESDTAAQMSEGTDESETGTEPEMGTESDTGTETGEEETGLLECGTDCWGPEGCKTEEGRCIRFSCRLDTDGEDFCDTCMGWNEITYEQWLGEGYCEDVIDKFRTEYGYATACGGGVASCCGDQASCAGDYRAWNFRGGETMYFTGPCLNCEAEPDDCTYWNEPIPMPGGTHSRISACERY